MNEVLLEQLQTCKNNGIILKNKIIAYEFSQEFHDDLLILNLTDIKAVIPKSEFDIKPTKYTSKYLIGRNIEYVITEIKDDIIICSRKLVQGFKKEQIIDALEKGEIFKAKITHIEKFGCYLSIKGVSVTLKNTDFATDYTTVSDLHKMGDKIEVKLKKITPTKKILVEAVTKYENPIKIDIHNFTEKSVVKGVIKSIKVWGCYVTIAPNLDVLTPPPDDCMLIEEGDKVAILIKEIDFIENKIRGRIQRVLDPED